eukprot:504243-Prymnesium_polylepis.2
MQLRQREKQEPQLSPLVGSAAGTGPNRRLVLPIDGGDLSTFGGSEPPAPEEAPMAADGAEEARPSLPYGIKCLRNALQ